MKIILPLNVKDRDIAKIVQIANSTKKDVIARSDRWVIDAKSLLGMIALFHEGLIVEIESENKNTIEIINTLF